MAAHSAGRREARGADPAPRRTLPLVRSLASPLGIFIVFPGLVLAVGLFLTLAGQQALRGSNVGMGKRQLGDQAKLVASNLRGALAQAEPMLDELEQFARGHDSQLPLEPAASMMRNLMDGRSGVALVTLSFPDGAFQAAFVDGDGTVRFQESRLDGGVTRMRRFDYRGYEALSQRSAAVTSYDPRQRDFYELAVAAGSRVWTPPYAFFDTYYTGVSRAQPVFRDAAGGRQLHAVIAVDFDLHELSKLLKTDRQTDLRTLLFTRSGTLLAFPEAEQRIAELPLRLDRTLSYRDLNDRVLDTFFAELGKAPAARDDFVRFEAGGTEYLAMQAPVSLDAALDWTLAYLVPESSFFESLHQHRRRSFVIAAGAVLLALGASLAFARMIVAARKEAAEAREAARRADREAKELGSYRLIKCLGKGGMGEVWRAEHRLLAREAAIKLVRMDGEAPSREANERFRREAQTLASLRSRNTIELFDYGVADDGTFFYVMELLDGLDLESLVEQHGPQPPGRVVRLLMQACRSLGEAHDAGLVHRDVKPANLFVCRAAEEVDVVKVLDFGLVRSLAADQSLFDPKPSGAQPLHAAETQLAPHLTVAGSVMGTPHFMAPEQALGLPLDARADIYALGCVAYWLLTGHCLFEKADTMQVLLAQVAEAPPLVSERAPGEVPLGLERIVAECLAKEAGQRPQRARDLFERLASVERELPPELRWTDERAAAWWREHQPRPAAPLPGGLTPSPQLLVVAGGGRS